MFVIARAIEKTLEVQLDGQSSFRGHPISHTNAPTISQSSALDPENFCFRRKCNRRPTATLARTMKIAFVAIIARAAMVDMIASCAARFF